MGKKYDHRDFKETRDYGPNAITERIGSSVNLKEKQIFRENTRNKLNNINYEKNVLDDLSLDDEDEMDIYQDKEKPAVRNNFFYGGAVKYKRKTAEEVLKKKKSNFFKNDDDKNDEETTGRKKGFKYHHNYIPEEYEDEDEAKEDEIKQFANIKLSFLGIFIT